MAKGDKQADSALRRKCGEMKKEINMALQWLGQGSITLLGLWNRNSTGRGIGQLTLMRFHMRNRRWGIGDGKEKKAG